MRLRGHESRPERRHQPRGYNDSEVVALQELRIYQLKVADLIESAVAYSSTRSPSIQSAIHDDLAP